MSKKISNQEARDLCWRAGIIAEWYLREDQKPLYDLISQTKNPFLECSRRYGKTTSILCFVLEELLRSPGTIALWCEPDKNQAREILRPEIAKIFETAPSHLRPVWSSVDSYYWFPSTGNQDTASRLKLRGVNHDRGDSARGSFAHIIVADEYGTWKDPEYIVNSALRPQLQTTNGPFIIASTPPEDLDHPYFNHKDEAVRDGRFIQRIIYDNASLSPERIKEIIKESGGENSPAWKREYLCQKVSDPERLVVPEYDPLAHDLEDGQPRPPHFHWFCGADLGFNDYTASLFVYWDFEKRLLVVENELFCRGRNSREIADASQRIEKETFGSKAPRLRVADGSPQQIYDLLTLCNYSLQKIDNSDPEADIAALRLRFTRGQIKIKKRCKNLRYQLEVGLWNERRTDFQRSKSVGHLDGIMALAYISRTVALYENENPYPRYEGMSSATHHINPESNSQGTGALKEAFRPFARGRG